MKGQEGRNSWITKTGSSSRSSPIQERYIQELQRVATLSYDAYKMRFDLLKLPCFPRVIRPFHLSIDVQQPNQSLYPIWERCNEKDGLLDVELGMDNFEQAVFAYPSMPLLANFQGMLEMSQRKNVIESQIPFDPSGQDPFVPSPEFKSHMGDERLKNALHRQYMGASRVLRNNRWNPDNDQVIHSLQQDPVHYDPPQLDPAEDVSAPSVLFNEAKERKRRRRRREREQQQG